MTTTQQFATANQFASFMSAQAGRSLLRALNKNSLEYKLECLVKQCELLCSSRYDLLQFEYNPVSYGLAWVVRTGRINWQTHAALKAMNYRQLCCLCHELLKQCGTDQGTYAAYLMQKFTQA